MFTVCAGKWDGNEQNTKYIESFVSFEQALLAWTQVQDYPWSELEYAPPFSEKRFILRPIEQ